MLTRLVSQSRQAEGLLPTLRVISAKSNKSLVIFTMFEMVTDTSVDVLEGDSRTP